MAKQLAGTRIRDRRIARGFRQADLARAAGISPSYLNLIEHNRRRIGGKVLNEIARILEVDASVLAEGAAEALVEALGAAARVGQDGVDFAEPAVDFASRYPGWADLVVAQASRIEALEDRVAALSDRVSHDPQLETALHEVLSVVTSIRSTASILVGSDGLDRDWETRFYRNIFDDSVRLADSSQALANYLEAPQEAGRPGQSPVQELVEWLGRRGHHVPQLEIPGADVDAYCDAQDWPSAAAAELGRRWMTQYRRDTDVLPLDEFAPLAAAYRCDPGALAVETGASLPCVMRRLSTLPRDVAGGLPAIGLAVCDGAGALTHQKDLPDFSLPLTAPGCPLLPLYEALSRPGHPIRSVIAMPGGSAPRLTAYAFAMVDLSAAFDEPHLIGSTMLIVADAPDGAPRPVGRTCRICPRGRCPARREPAIVPVND